VNGRPWWVSAAQFAGIGWYIAGAILAPTLGGVWLDRKAGTSPLFLLLGLLLGVSVGFYGTYRMAVTYLASSQDSEEPKAPDS
jgi:ATP synthase protein I